MVVKIINYQLNKPIDLKEPVSLALGYFDGLHIGHLSLANKVKDFAKKHNTASAMMTFSPNPLITLGKIKEEHYLTTFADRADILKEEGIDYLIIVEFTKEVSQLSPEQFYQAFITPLNVKCIVCGFDYHFGAKGQGTGKSLIELAKDTFPVYIQDEVTLDGKKVSSTRIHQNLINGNIEEVTSLLGRHYAIQGEIIKGRQIGRTIGFPTANIDYKHYAIPKKGVYGVKIEIDGKEYLGMCNIGYNPTFDSLDHESLEVHIFDFDKDVYGKIAKVYFYFFIRDEVKFASPEHLIHQLNQDKQKIIDYFTS